MGLRASIDVPEEASTAQEEDELASGQNLTPEQREEEPGQYGRYLRLYAGDFRGLNKVEGKEEVVEENQLNIISGSDQAQSVDQRLLRNVRPGAKLPPRGINTAREYHTSAKRQSFLSKMIRVLTGKPEGEKAPTPLNVAEPISDHPPIPAPEPMPELSARLPTPQLARGHTPPHSTTPSQSTSTPLTQTLEPMPQLSARLPALQPTEGDFPPQTTLTEPPRRIRRIRLNPEPLAAAPRLNIKRQHEGMRSDPPILSPYRRLRLNNVPEAPTPKPKPTSKTPPEPYRRLRLNNVPEAPAPKPKPTSKTPPEPTTVIKALAGSALLTPLRKQLPRGSPSLAETLKNFERIMKLRDGYEARLALGHISTVNAIGDGSFTDVKAISDGSSTDVKAISDGCSTDVKAISDGSSIELASTTETTSTGVALSDVSPTSAALATKLPIGIPEREFQNALLRNLGMKFRSRFLNHYREYSKPLEYSAVFPRTVNVTPSLFLLTETGWDKAEYKRRKSALNNAPPVKEPPQKPVVYKEPDYYTPGPRRIEQALPLERELGPDGKPVSHWKRATPLKQAQVGQEWWDKLVNKKNQPANKLRIRRQFDYEGETRSHWADIMTRERWADELIKRQKVNERSLRKNQLEELKKYKLAADKVQGLRDWE